MQGEAVLQLTTKGIIQEEVSLLEADEVLIQDRSVAAGGGEEACQSGLANQRGKAVEELRSKTLSCRLENSSRFLRFMDAIHHRDSLTLE